MDRKLFTALMYGWTTILFFILTASTLLTFIIRYSTITEFTLSYVTLIIGLLTMFTGGLVAGIKGKTNGWMIGILIGVGFTLFTFLVQYFNYQELFSMKQSIFHATYVLCAIIGSIIGVNLFRSEEDQTASYPS